MALKKKREHTEISGKDDVVRSSFVLWFGLAYFYSPDPKKKTSSQNMAKYGPNIG